MLRLVVNIHIKAKSMRKYFSVLPLYVWYVVCVVSSTRFSPQMAWSTLCCLLTISILCAITRRDRLEGEIEGRNGKEIEKGLHFRLEWVRLKVLLQHCLAVNQAQTRSTRGVIRLTDLRRGVVHAR